MNDPTAQERETCSRKRHWTIQGNAEAFSRRLANLNPRRPAAQAYQCGVCGGWCLTTPMDSESRSRKKKRARR